MWEMDESKNARAKLDRYGHPVGKYVSYRKMLPFFGFFPRDMRKRNAFVAFLSFMGFKYPRGVHLVTKIDTASEMFFVFLGGKRSVFLARKNIFRETRVVENFVGSLWQGKNN